MQISNLKKIIIINHDMNNNFNVKISPNNTKMFLEFYLSNPPPREAPPAIPPRLNVGAPLISSGGALGSVIISRICSWRIVSLLSGTKYLRTFN